jgi:hypothetical protein
LNLAIEPSSAALDQGHICSQAHFVDMSSGVQIIQGIKDNPELTEPRDSEFVVLDIGMMGDDLHVWIEPFGNLFRNLFCLLAFVRASSLV